MLDPNIKKSPWTKEEEVILLHAHGTSTCMLRLGAADSVPQLYTAIDGLRSPRWGTRRVPPLSSLTSTPSYFRAGQTTPSRIISTGPVSLPRSSADDPHRSGMKKKVKIVARHSLLADAQHDPSKELTCTRPLSTQDTAAMRIQVCSFRSPASSDLLPPPDLLHSASSFSSIHLATTSH
eukprot:122103-Hanusia_phi.AAC.1